VSTRVRIIVGVAVLVVLIGGALFANLPFIRVRGAYGLVDETTLTVHHADVQVQRPGEAFTAVTGDVPVRLGDRIKTGPGGYATVTYFEGSTTTLDENTDIILRRMDKLPDGGAQISFHQELGRTWNRVQHLVDANSRFEGTTASAVAFVRGTEFILTVTGDGRTLVEAVSETVFVEANGVTVEVPPGFITSVAQGQAPTTPVPAPPARFGFRVDVQGAARPFLVDNVNRSAGFQPEVGIYGSQIPGAKLIGGDGSVSLMIPNPMSNYDLTVTAVGNGGPYTVTITGLENGQPVASRAFGLARSLANQEQLSGNIAAGKRHGTAFEFHDGRIVNLRRPMSDGQGLPDGSHMLFARSQTAANPDVVGTAVAEGTAVARGTPTSARTASTGGGPTAAPATAIGAATGGATATLAGTSATPATQTLTPPPGSTATPTPAGGTAPTATAPGINGGPGATATSVPGLSPIATATAAETPEAETPAPTATIPPPTSTPIPTFATPVATLPVATEPPVATIAQPFAPPPPQTGFFGFSNGGGFAPPPGGVPNPGPQPGAPVIGGNAPAPIGPNIPQIVVRGGGPGGTAVVPTQRPLATLEALAIQGDYVAAGVGLRGASSGTINLSGIPAGSTIRRAYLLWGMLDNGESPSLRTLSFNGTPLTGVNIGSGPDTCWDRTNSHAYRANVTALVTGNGSYALTGVATGGNILGDGASLVAIYENPLEPLRTVQLYEGNLVLSIRINRPATASMQLTGFTAGQAPSGKSTFIVGDGQSFTDAASFDGGLSTVALTNPFDGTDGQLWDTETISITGSISPGATSALASLSTDEDCLMWVGQAFSVTTGAAAPITPTPVPTIVPTATSIATIGATPSPTNTPEPAPEDTATPTPTTTTSGSPLTLIPTSTIASTVTLLATPTPTAGPSHTPTATVVPTQTVAPTLTFTPVIPPTATLTLPPTATPTPCPTSTPGPTPGPRPC